MRKSIVPVGLAVLMAATAASAATFTQGNVVVTRIGDGVNTYASGIAAPVYIDEYTASGGNVNSVALPSAASGSYNATMPLSYTDCGYLRRSTDGRYLSFFGYDVAGGVTTSGNSYRTVARVDRLGAVDTSTRISATGAQPRSASSVDGSAFWVAMDTGSGTTGGLRYVTLGGSSGTLLTSSPTTNLRGAAIYNGQLYIGTAAATPKGVYQIGTGIPTTSGQTSASVLGSTNPITSIRDFYFANANTLYIAEETSGVQKWVQSGGTWTKSWSALPSGSTGLRGLTGATDALGNVTLYGITAEATSTAQNKLVALSDTLGGITAPGFTTLATSSANTVFRGVALAPIPEPATLLLFASGALILRRRRM